MVQHPAGTAAAWMAEKGAGSADWWLRLAEVGMPLVEQQADDPRLKLTFFWRDPYGDETASSIRRVYLDVNGVTNHHGFSPSPLERIPGSNIWTASIQMFNDWRGSYSLIPISEAQLPPEP